MAGLRIDTSGRATYLDAPAGWNDRAFPRVLYEPGQGWHAVWADQSSDTASHSVRLVYGLFDGQRWIRIKPIGEFGRSWWGPSAPSQLIRTQGGLALGAPVNQGVTLLTERDQVWTVRRVAAAHSAAYSALIVEQDTLIMAYAGYDRSDSVALAVIRSSDGGVNWSSPVTVTLGAAYEPALVRMGDALALIWLTGREMLRPRGLRVSMSRDGGASWTEPTPVPGAEEANRFSYATVLGDQLLLVGEINPFGATRQTWQLLDRNGRARPIRYQSKGSRFPTLASDGGGRVIMLADTGTEGAFVMSRLTLACQP